MESGKRSIGRSLQFRLIVIFCTLGIIATFFASFQSYKVVRDEALDFIDEELSQMAAVVINYNMTIPRRWEGPRHGHEHMFRQGLRMHVGGLGKKDIIISLDRDNAKKSFEIIESKLNKKYDIIIAPLYGRVGDEIFVPPGVNDGFYNVLVSDIRMRIIVATKMNGKRFIVGRPFSALEEISNKTFMTSALQFLAIVLMYIPTVIVSVNLMFRAIYRIAKRIDKRKDDDLSKIESGDTGYIPSELNSFIRAINGLLQRVDDSVKTQRRFIADAAHEMRTPLTALTLQAEALSHEELSPTARAKLKDLLSGIKRERDLMTSLLTLARTQNSSGEVAKSLINVQDLYIKLVEDLGSLADDKDIDFGVDGDINYTFIGSMPDILCVMTNLVSNALKYTNEGGRVDLVAHVQDGEIYLGVKDTGSGIAKDLLDKVFEPFFRVDGDRQEIVGTGLGLAIAKAAADRAHGRIILNNNEPHGLIASLILPYTQVEETKSDTKVKSKGEGKE